MVCQGEFSHRIAEVAKKAYSSFEAFDQDLECLEDPPAIAINAMSSLPCRPELPVMTDSHFEGSLTENVKQVYRWNGEEYTNGTIRSKIRNQCMYIFVQ